MKYIAVTIIESLIKGKVVEPISGNWLQVDSVYSLLCAAGTICRWFLHAFHILITLLTRNFLSDDREKFTNGRRSLLL
jgi:hypothetical protein